MVERSNGRISDVLATRRYVSGGGVQSPHCSESAALAVTDLCHETVAGDAA